MPHPDDETLRLFAVGRLTEKQGDDIEAHLGVCESCTRRLDDIERKRSDPFFRRMKATQADKSDAVALPDRTPGCLLSGRFRLESELGRGGMGEAWKAFDITAQRHVVLKFVQKDVQNVGEAMDAVRDSFQKVHALQHAHICPLYQLENDSEHGFFLVMKFIDGLSLHDYRRQHDPLPFDDIVQMLHDVADALDYAHSRQVIHRDVKPANIMIGETDGTQLIDFGLADKIHATHSAPENVSATKIDGTRSYMAPEQWEGKRQDAQTDQYALAVTAYELLAGHPPFSDTDTEALKNKVIHDPPAPIPDQPAYVNAALCRGLAKNPHDRFPSCQAFVEAMGEPEYRLKGRRKIFLSGIRIAAMLIPALLMIFVIFHIVSPGYFSKQSNVPNFEPVQGALQPRTQNKSNTDSSTHHFDEITEQPDTQEKPSTVLRARNEIFDTLRVTVAIDADGVGQISAKRGFSNEPIPPFNGTPFQSGVFHYALSLHGDAPGIGRVLFPTGDPTPIVPHHLAALEPGRSHGWECFCSGVSSDYAQGTRIDMEGEVIHGFIFSKAGGLPYTITFEVVDNDDYPPTLELVLSCAHVLKKSTTITCYWEREEEGQLRMAAFSSDSPKKNKRIIADDIMLELGKSVAKPFQLPQDIALKIEKIQCRLRVAPHGSPPGFDLTLLDISGHFRGNVGFSIEDRDGTPIVGKREWSNPAVMKPATKNSEKRVEVDRSVTMSEIPMRQGDAILSVNGQAGPAPQLQGILDSLSYGDLVKVEYVSQRDNRTRTGTYRAE